MPHLFEPIRFREIVLRNRIGVSPMAQYSAREGHATDWHLVHLGSRAVGGAGLVSTEGTCVSPEGRNSMEDLGLWNDDHVSGHRRLTDFVRGQGAVPAIQLGHGGRKAAKRPTWQLGPTGWPGSALTIEEGAWPLLAPSAVPFDEFSSKPGAMSIEQIADVRGAFLAATRRAVSAGYDWVELHAAHGYLLHSFLSPISNHRTDRYGGSLENRSRLVREIAQSCREVLGEERVLAVRLSYTDWETSGWSIEDTVHLARWLKEDRVDLIDVSSGGSTPLPNIPLGPAYQLPGAIAVKTGADIPVAAVGLITQPEQADQIIRSGQADLIYLAREMLHSPYWPLAAAKQLGHVAAVQVPAQYDLAHRAEPRAHYVERPVPYGYL